MNSVRAGLPVLTYHSIDPRRSVTTTGPAWFAATLAALLGAGYRAVCLDDWVARGRPDEPRGFALAFDDGLRSVLRVADVVARLRLPATVFLVTGRVGTDNAWPGQRRGVAVEPMLSWPDVRDLDAAGFRFGAHGLTHTRMDRLDDARLAGELASSRATIEDRVGRPCRLLAYPYGVSTPAVRLAASRVFAAGFGTRLDYAGVGQDPFDLARVDAYYLRSRRVLDALINGRAGLVPLAQGPAGGPSPYRGFDRRGGGIGMTPEPVCPACRGPLDPVGVGGLACAACPRVFPAVAGLPDLRLASDRYLDLDAERAKAGRLQAVEDGAGADVRTVAAAYYAMTDDVVDRRRDRFLRHIDGAEARGRALADRIPGGGTVLEIGCGTGGLVVAAARAGRPVVGVDIAARWLVVARRRLADRGLRAPLVAAEAERLPWPDATFDAVAADSVLEHLDDPAPASGNGDGCSGRRRGVVWSPNRFTLTTDPHLGLWGVGWLPRRWVPGYLRMRGGPTGRRGPSRRSRRGGWRSGPVSTGSPSSRRESPRPGRGRASRPSGSRSSRTPRRGGSVA